MDTEEHHLLWRQQQRRRPPRRREVRVRIRGLWAGPGGQVPGHHEHLRRVKARRPDALPKGAPLARVQRFLFSHLARPRAFPCGQTAQVDHLPHYRPLAQRHLLAVARGLRVSLP